MLAQGMGEVALALTVYDNYLAEALEARQSEVSAHLMKLTGIILLISLTFANWRIIIWLI